MIAEMFELREKNLEVDRSRLIGNPFLYCLELEKSVRIHLSKLFQEVCEKPTQLHRVINDIDWDILLGIDLSYRKNNTVIETQLIANRILSEYYPKMYVNQLIYEAEDIVTDSESNKVIQVILYEAQSFLCLC